eukprot:CAMPEP_0197579570 /NCGR_PEP_ID=MMETSP1326-20131121/3552_1 /TAXON_ID=1155430 /ORGANISM="Genus nov. species nov., Strain RCC2288" /LENGTH=753 /DNA_ID=CAMNT_0043143083 /DNA_START=133 /DNA_END=2391 /DNA_ORIENTATION=+
MLSSLSTQSKSLLFKRSSSGSETAGGAVEMKSQLDAVVVDAQRAQSPTSGLRSQSPGGSFRAGITSNSPEVKTASKEEDDQDVDDDLLGKRNGGEMEAVLEARQLAQLRMGWKVIVRSLCVVAIGGAIFLAVTTNRIDFRLGGASPWRWATYLACVFGARHSLQKILDLVMLLLDRKHVVAKRVSFILGGIDGNLVFTLYCLVLLITWSALLKDAADGVGKWGEMHLLIRRILSSMVAWGAIHTVSKGVSRYMQVFFQREAYFFPLMKALAEEFVVVTLLAICSVDMRQWQAEHGLPHGQPQVPATVAESAGDGNIRRTSSANWSRAGQEIKKEWARANDEIKKVAGLINHFQEVTKQVITEGTPLASFLRMAKESLPIKTDMIVLKEGSVQPTDVSLARLHKMGAHVRRKKINLPEKFLKNANNAPCRGDLPKLADDEIIHKSVANTTALRMAAVIRQLQRARKFVPLDPVFFNQMGLPKEVQAKVMEVLDPDNKGAVSREQLVQRMGEIYERRRDLAKSLASTNSVLDTLERIVLSALYVVLLFIVLGIFGQNILEMWFTVSSMMLAFVFMFGNSIRLLFESVIFIFVVHPFDVGDDVIIDGDRHAIKNISILTTELQKWSGQTIYYPNGAMMNRPLINLTRTKNLTDDQTWVVDISTPQRVLESLQMYMEAYQRDNAVDFNDISTRYYSHATEPRLIKLTLFYTYSFNGLPASRSGAARNKLGLAMRKFLVDNGVLYRQPMSVELSGGFV